VPHAAGKDTEGEYDLAIILADGLSALRFIATHWNSGAFAAAPRPRQLALLALILVEQGASPSEMKSAKNCTPRCLWC